MGLLLIPFLLFSIHENDLCPMVVQLLAFWGLMHKSALLLCLPWTLDHNTLFSNRNAVFWHHKVLLLSSHSAPTILKTCVWGSMWGEIIQEEVTGFWLRGMYTAWGSLTVHHTCTIPRRAGSYATTRVAETWYYCKQTQLSNMLLKSGLYRTFCLSCSSQYCSRCFLQ